MTREAPTPGSIIPAATLAEFIARGVERYGSIRSAAEESGIPYSTLRGWLGLASVSYLVGVAIRPTLSATDR